MKKIFKCIGYLFLVFLIWSGLWALTIFTPLRTITGPIVDFTTFPMQASIRNNWPVMVKILATTPLKERSVAGFKGGCTKPIDIAASRGLINIIDILLDSGAQEYGCDGHVLSSSVRHPKLIHHLLANRKLNPLSVNKKNSDYAFLSTFNCNISEIHMPIDKKLNSSLEYFLDNGVDPNLITSAGRYGKKPLPIMAIAVLSGCKYQIDTLLASGADPIKTEKSLHNYFELKGSLEGDAAYGYNSDRFLSERMKESIVKIKRAVNVLESLKKRE